MTRPKDPERAETEARLQQAIAAYRKQQKKSKKVSLRRIAKDFNIPRQSLQNRLDGKLPRNQAHEQLMHLTIEEEKELVHWITTRLCSSLSYRKRIGGNNSKSRRH